MDSVLVNLFRHTRWANLQLLDAVEALSDEQLATSAAGTYGTIPATLVHMVRAEASYLARLAGADAPPPDDLLGSPSGLAAIRVAMEQNGDKLIQLARTLSSDTITRGDWRGGSYELPSWVPLLQAVDHDHEHRTNITTIMQAIGVEPPDLHIPVHYEVGGT